MGNQDSGCDVPLVEVLLEIRIDATACNKAQVDCRGTCATNIANLVNELGNPLCLNGALLCRVAEPGADQCLGYIGDVV